MITLPRVSLYLLCFHSSHHLSVIMAASTMALSSPSLAGKAVKLGRSVEAVKYIGQWSLEDSLYSWVQAPCHIFKELEAIANHFQNNPNAQLILKYDEALSHAIYAASDMFIVPSIFEPCGLPQMIAMRYGSIPIVRKTGGLNDSVFDVDDDKVPPQFRNGFTFLTPDEQGVNKALERAFDSYTKNRKMWQQLVQKNMKTNFSWESYASQYEELYRKAVRKAKYNARKTHT